MTTLVMFKREREPRLRHPIYSIASDVLTIAFPYLLCIRTQLIKVPCELYNFLLKKDFATSLKKGFNYMVLLHVSFSR